MEIGCNCAAERVEMSDITWRSRCKQPTARIVPKPCSPALSKEFKVMNFEVSRALGLVACSQYISISLALEAVTKMNGLVKGCRLHLYQHSFKNLFFVKTKVQYPHHATKIMQ